MKKIIMSLCMLALAAVLFGTSTYAWFSMNREVDAKGMKVKARVESSLVITSDALPTDATRSYTVDFADSNYQELYNSTHTEETKISTDGDNTTKLMTIDNPRVIDVTTGLQKSGTDPSTGKAWAAPVWKAATNTASKTYYVDYVVYIAALQEQITGKDLTVTFSGLVGTNAVDATGVNGAVSADIYYASVSAVKDSNSLDGWTYADTLNLAGVKRTTSGKTSEQEANEQTSITISGLTFPKALAENNTAVAVLIRVYVDGALLKTESSTYVNTADSTNISEISLLVDFKVQE